MSRNGRCALTRGGDESQTIEAEVTAILQDESYREILAVPQHRGKNDLGGLLKQQEQARQELLKHYGGGAMDKGEKIAEVHDA